MGAVHLVNRVNELIAARSKVSVEDLTGAYIEKRRRERRLPVDDANEYGGRTRDGLEHLSDAEVASALETFKCMVAEVEPH
jgi:hypothetical protein